MICIQNIVNSKVAVIDEEGQLYIMGSVNEKNSHVIRLLNYLEEKYPNVNTDSLKIGSPRDHYGYVFGKLNNIIYFNDIKFGMFYFPDEVNEMQLETLESLDLGDKKVAICYNLKENGMFPMVGGEGDYNLNEALEVYLQRIKRKARRR